MPRKLKSVLLKAAKSERCGDDDIQSISSHAWDDINEASLAVQLEQLSTAMAIYRNPTLLDIRDYFRSLSLAQRGNLSEVGTLLKLILVAPATNAVSERSASAASS